jgi:hypothetical protein
MGNMGNNHPLTSLVHVLLLRQAKSGSPNVGFVPWLLWSTSSTNWGLGWGCKLYAYVEREKEREMCNILIHFNIKWV